MIEALNALRETGSDRSTVQTSQRDRTPWLIFGFALLLGLAFVGSDLAFNQGKLIAPLDDVYIHLQYGKQIGLGHFFQFNTGDQVSSGASSFLYALVLGLAYLVGFTGHWLLVFAMGFNILCFAGAAALTQRLGARLVARPVGLWAALLLSCSGPLLWGTASGMEVGFAAFLVVATTLLFVVETPSGRFVWTPLAGVLLALVRPEGLIYAGVLTITSWWVLWTHRRTAGRRRVALRWPVTLLPLLAGAGQLAFYQLATGTTTANGVQAKSILYDRAIFYFSDFVERALANLRAMIGLFLGFTNGDFAFPGAMLLFFAGLVYLVLLRRAWRPVLIGLFVALVAVMVSVSTLATALWHYLRYEQPFLPILMVFVASGAYGITRVVPVAARRLALHGGLSIALVFSLLAVPGWAVRFGHDAATIRDTDVSVGAWINGNVPPGKTVAVKDVGAAAYFGNHHVIDLIGLGTNGFAEASNNGVGAVYEALRHLPAAQRPAYFATYDAGPGVSMEQMRQVGILTMPDKGDGPEPLQRFVVHTPPDLSGSLIVPFPEIDVYRADWTLADTGDDQQVPGTLRDYLNVGDLTSEKAHGYTPEMEQVASQPTAILARLGDVIDSGRNIQGGEAFTAHNLVPGKPLTLTSRTKMDKIVPDMAVYVDGKPAGTWVREPGKTGPWTTYTYQIPENLITGPNAQIELRPPRPLLNPYPLYDSYGYWLSQ